MKQLVALSHILCDLALILTVSLIGTGGCKITLLSTRLHRRATALAAPGTSATEGYIVLRAFEFGVRRPTAVNLLVVFYRTGFDGSF